MLVNLARNERMSPPYKIDREKARGNTINIDIVFNQLRVVILQIINAFSVIFKLEMIQMESDIIVLLIVVHKQYNPHRTRLHFKVSHHKQRWIRRHIRSEKVRRRKL